MSSTSLHVPARPRRRRTLVCLVVALLTLVSLVGGQGTALGAEVVGHRAHAHEGWSATANGSVTGEKPESKLWYHDGAWWASMVQPATGAHSVHLLAEGTWWDTGTVVDASPIAKEDVLLVGDTLYVTTRGTWQLRRFSYLQDGGGIGDGRWVLDAGFPAQLPVNDAETLTLARDTTGTLWIAWTRGDDLRVAHTTGSDTSWGSAFTPAVPGTSGLDGDDIASVIAFTDDVGPAIGVMWSDQARDVQRFAVHRDGEPPAAWTVETALSGPREADDHINLKTFEGRIYAVVKTGHNASANPLIRLLVRSSSGSWTAHPVARYDERDTRPITMLQIDPAQRVIYVFMARQSSGRNSIVYKASSINGIGFPTEATPFIDSLTTSVNNPTSMKANATAASGVVVMASDGSHYWWNRIGGDGTEPPPPPPAGDVSVQVSTSGEGVVVLDPPGGIYPAGTEVTLTAQPATGWSFTGWTGAATGTANPTTLVADTDVAVTATFLQDPDGEPGTGGPVALAQSVVGTATSATSVTTSQPVAADADQVYLASIATKPAREVTGITGMGLTWTPVVTQCAGRSQTGASIWVGSGTPSTGTVAAQTAGSAQTVLAVAGYTGVAHSAPVSAVASANTTGAPGACSGGTDGVGYDLTVPTTVGDGAVHAAVAMRFRSHTPGGDAVEDTETVAGAGGSAAGLATTHTAVTTSPTTRLTGTFSGTVDWAVAAATLRSADPGDPGPDPDPEPDPDPVDVTLEVATTGEGTVVLDPPGGTYAVGTEVTLTAQPATGWSFTGWSGGATGTVNPTALVVDADVAVTATFTEDPDGGGGDPDPAGPITLAQTVIGTADNEASVTTSQPVTADPTQVYLASIATKPAREVTGMTGMGLTWTPVVTQCAGRSQTAASIWVGSGTPTTGTVTATLDRTPRAVLAVSGYTGVDLADPIGAIASANTTGAPGACSGGTDGASYDLTVPTTGADGLVHAAVAMRFRSHTPGGDTVEDTETVAATGGNAAGLATTHSPVADPTRLTGTFSGSVDWAVAAVGLRSAGTP